MEDKLSFAGGEEKYQLGLHNMNKILKIINFTSNKTITGFYIISVVEKKTVSFHWLF